MGQLIAIPHAIKLLADEGAEVVRVESCGRLEIYRTTSFYGNTPVGDHWNRGANFYEQNRNKLGVTLDLNKPSGRELLKELISVADVFAENFTPRVMARFGLEYEDLRKVKPDIIMVSSTGFGYSGPWADRRAIGYTTEATSGLSYITGYPHGPPVLPEIPCADYTAAEHTAFAITAALVHRARTGRGQFIDVSQAETVSSTIPEALMDYTANGRVHEPIGNQHVSSAPHGCYPCLGEDAWIAVAATTDDQWASLCDTLDGRAWREDPRFGDGTARWEHREELDRLVGEATAGWDQYELMRRLQDKGVPAGAVVNGKQLLFDPHLKARGFYTRMAHHPSTGMPPLPYPGKPWKMSETPVRDHTPAPLMGEHNRHLLSNILGKPDSEIEALERDSVIGYRPLRDEPPRVVPLEAQKRQGRILDYDIDFEQRVRQGFRNREAGRSDDDS